MYIHPLGGLKKNNKRAILRSGSQTFALFQWPHIWQDDDILCQTDASCYGVVYTEVQVIAKHWC